MTEKEYLSITDLSNYLSIKAATLYSKAERGEIPCYKIGRLLRFKKSEIDQWMEAQRQIFIDAGEKAEKIIKSVNMDIDRLVKKAIESEKAQGYNQPHGEQASKEGR